MPDYVSIAYRGATYALGQGPQFYGIWYASALHVQPLESWPLTPEGWTAAWSKFVSVEVPGSITPVAPAAAGPVAGPLGPMTGPVGPVASPSGLVYGPGGQVAGSGVPVPGPGGPVAGPGSPVPGSGDPGAGYGAGPWAVGASSPAASWTGPAPYSRPQPDPAALTRTSRVAAALVAVGLVFGVVGLFPAYLAGASLSSQSYNLAPHVMYLAAWALSAVLIATGGMRLRAGALLGIGTSAVTLGLFIADAGTHASLGTGLQLSILGWLGCTAGVALAAAGWLRAGFGLARRQARQFGSQSSHDVVPLVTMILAAIGAAVAFAPSWDRFTVHSAVNGTTQTITQGNAFANAGPMIFGDVLVMIAIVVVVVVAALWRPLRLAAALAIGAAVPLVAQAISAVIQIAQLTSPEQLGVPASQVSGLGLTVDSGLTPIFWVYCAFVGTVILLCVWMLVAHGPAVPNQVLSAAAPSPGGIGVSAAAAPGPSSADAATTTAPWTGGSPGGQASSWDRPAS